MLKYRVNGGALNPFLYILYKFQDKFVYFNKAMVLATKAIHNG